MRKTTTYSPEVRERAVRMVLEHLNDYPSEWAAIECGFHADSDTHSTHIRTVVPR